VRKLASDEIPKLNALKPKRYLLVISLGLSRKNKAKIQTALSPWVTSESDIYGQEDLNDLLRRHSKVEQSHYKLWFGSVGVLTRLLNAKVVGRSQFKIEEAREFSSRYVATSSHATAAAKLEEMRAIIITGEPGVGKSTLAEQLALQYVIKDFELCCIATSLEEAEEFWDNERKQLFYFDDFLGRNYLLALQRNEDSHIVNFLKRVSRDARKRFILTSRTTVLNQGKSLTDLFRIANIERTEYEIRIDSLSLMDKGRILYSHIWHGSLGSEHIDEIYINKRYATISKHRNFNPRLIAFITDFQKVGNISAEKYWSYIEDTLSNPADVWAHVFVTQLNSSARLLVRLAVLNGANISEQDLMHSFHSYPKPDEMPAERADQFAAALQLSVGAVLNRTLNESGESATITLFNPSLGDYVASLRNLTALETGKIVTDKQCDEILSRLARVSLLNEKIDLPYRLDLANKCVMRKREANELPELDDFLRRLGNSDVSDRPDIQGWLLYEAASRGLVESDSDEYARKVESLIEASTDSDEFSALVAPLDRVPRDAAEPLIRRLAELYVQTLKESVRDSVYEDDILGDYRSPDDYDAVEKVRDHVRKRASSDGIEISEREISDIAAAVDYDAVMEANWSHVPSDDSSGWSGGGSSELSDLDDLFDRG